VTRVRPLYVYKCKKQQFIVTNGGFACRARGEGGNVCVCGIARLGLNAWMRERGSGKVSMRVNWR